MTFLVLFSVFTFMVFVWQIGSAREYNRRVNLGLMAIEQKHLAWLSPSRKKPSDPFYQSEAWKELREKALIRDHYQCQVCCSNQNLHVHHKIPRSLDLSLELDLDNLITLCQIHHDKIKPNSMIRDYRKPQQQTLIEQAINAM